MAVYVLEHIAVIGGGRGKLVEQLRRSWAPHVEQHYGVRAAGIWATVGSTAAWPEVTALWEMDDWEHFAAAMAAQYPFEERDPYALELWRQALEWRSGGTSALLEAAPFSPTVAQRRERGLDGPVYLYEAVRTLPGRMADYHAALEAEYVPVARERGLRLAGAYRHAVQPNVGVNLWAFRDWDHCREALEGEEGHPGVRRWRERCAGLLEDQYGWLLASPPAAALRT